MNYVGIRFIREGGRLSFNLPLVERLGFVVNDDVYVFIKEDAIYISKSLSDNPGIPIKIEKELGRISIPKQIRSAFDLKTKDEVAIYIDDDKNIVIRKSNYDREINIVRQLARECTKLHRDEKAVIDKLLTRMLVN